MTPILTTKLKLFLQRMSESDELAQTGFQLLLKRPDSTEFFDLLNEAGLFAPDCNPAPIRAGQPEYVHISFWPALPYLETVAKKAGEGDDLTLAAKVMAVVRTVSSFRESDGSARDNYHTYRVFAAILGLVPVGAVTKEDLDLIPQWLNNKYESGMVAHTLDQGVIGKLLASDSLTERYKACVIVRHCTAIGWTGGLPGRKKPVPVVKDVWLSKLVKHHAVTLGVRVGKEAADLFLERVRELFGKEGRDKGPSWVWRPAIEDHDQNHSRYPENIFIEGLRDLLLSWVDQEPSVALPYAYDLMVDDAEVVRRVAIYLINHRWRLFRDSFFQFVEPKLFDQGHLHELCGLLRDHFHDFSDEEKAKTVDAIREIPPPDKGDASTMLLRDAQRKWLLPLVGKGYPPVDAWFQELQSDPSLSKLSDHSDFHVYMESWSGPGPSPFTTAELIAWAKDGSLIENMNNLQPGDTWRGSPIRALVDTLEEAIGIAPDTFLGLLPDFVMAKRPYQYGIINGFKRLWGMSLKDQALKDWDRAWEALVRFFEAIMTDDDFWNEEIDSDQRQEPNRDWIPSAIAGFLEAGTKNDSHAYPVDLLPRTWQIVTLLLKKLPPASLAAEDAMSQALNTEKGRAIEALFCHALRQCRVADYASGRHTEVWADIEPIFDHELEQCKGTNFEFSTLAGAYLANIDYMDRQWLQSKFTEIFSPQFPDNFSCALEGLAYAPATAPLYALLRDNEIIDIALQKGSKGHYLREKLIERIALAYLWGEEQLDSPRLLHIFSSQQRDDLTEICKFFWSINSQEVTGEQVERILRFWEQCLEWSKNCSAPPEELLSALSRLTCYIQSVGDREAGLLRSVTPYLKVDFNAENFIEELERLAETNPAEVCEIFEQVLESYVPMYDFEGKIKSLLMKFYDQGLWDKVMVFSDSLRHILEIRELFDQLKPTNS